MILGNLAVLPAEHSRHIAMEIGQLGDVVAAIVPDGSNALQLSSDLLLGNPSQAGLIHVNVGDGSDLPMCLILKACSTQGQGLET